MLPRIYKAQEWWRNRVIYWKRMSEKKRILEKKRVKEEGRSYFRSPQKYECHSHIAPFDKKEWHSSFAPYFGSGAQEWRSKECRSLTHWQTGLNVKSIRPNNFQVSVYFWFYCANIISFRTQLVDYSFNSTIQTILLLPKAEEIFVGYFWLSARWRIVWIPF